MLAKDRKCPLKFGHEDEICEGEGCGWFAGSETDKDADGKKNIGRCSILDIASALAGIHNKVVKG